jgi:peptidoglycan-associated lipoprotein
MMLGAALTLVSAGCVKHPTPLTELRNPAPTPVENGTPTPEVPIFNQNPLPVGNPNGTIPVSPNEVATKGIPHPEILQNDTIYFAYDKSAVRGGEEPKLADVANYMKSNPQNGLRITGNCDERGTEEYNRSLGERRALAAREYLAAQGIDPQRMDVISYGKDKPAVDGHDEAAWSKNRRDEFIVMTPQ